MVAEQEDELVGLGQGPLRPDGKVSAVLGKRVQREGNPLHSRELAPKWVGGLATDRGGKASSSRGSGVKGKGELSRGGKAMASGACQGSVWTLVVQCRLLATT